MTYREFVVQASVGALPALRLFPLTPYSENDRTRRSSPREKFHFVDHFVGPLCRKGSSSCFNNIVAIHRCSLQHYAEMNRPLRPEDGSHKVVVRGRLSKQGQTRVFGEL